jgi:hypothetical protein
VGKSLGGSAADVHLRSGWAARRLPADAGSLVQHRQLTARRGGVFGALRDRRLDTIGLTVLLGTGSGAVLSVIVNSPRPTLLFTGVVPIVVFAIACLLSLRRSPLIYEIALAYFGGPHSDRGAKFAARWDDEAGFRRYFRRVTTGWGVAYLAEASVKTTIVLTASTGTALVATGALSFAVLGLLAAWMIIYAYVAQR